MMMMHDMFFTFLIDADGSFRKLEMVAELYQLLFVVQSDNKLIA